MVNAIQSCERSEPLSRESVDVPWYRVDLDQQRGTSRVFFPRGYPLVPRGKPLHLPSNNVGIESTWGAVYRLKPHSPHRSSYILLHRAAFYLWFEFFYWIVIPHWPVSLTSLIMVVSWIQNMHLKGLFDRNWLKKTNLAQIWKNP